MIDYASGLVNEEIATEQFDYRIIKPVHVSRAVVSQQGVRSSIPFLRRISEAANAEFRHG